MSPKSLAAARTLGECVRTAEQKPDGRRDNR